jgi:hypothetical protein
MLTRLCAGPASVPMEIAGSREFVSITVPGSKTPGALRFHVDTGGNTPGLMVRRSAIERLGFASVEALPRAIHVGERDIPLPGGADWTVIDDEADPSKLERATRKDFAAGQLGAGFLSRFVVCVDPGHGRLGLGDPQEFDLEPGDAKWVPLLMMPGGPNHALYPFVHVLLLDHGAFAGGYGLLLDTGATTSMLDRAKIDLQRGKHPDWPRANGAFGDADMIGGPWAEELLRVGETRLNSPGQLSALGQRERMTIDLGPATFLDRPDGTWGKMFGNVGMTMGSHGAVANDVLLRHRIVLDYPHARLYVDPSGRPPDASASSARVGIAVVFGANGCPEVRQVADTNAADTRSKIQVGDVLSTIDGKDACSMFHHEIAAALAGTPGTVKKLRLRRGAATLDVDAATAELLAPPP